MDVYSLIQPSNSTQSMGQGLSLGQSLRKALDQNQERQKQDQINQAYTSNLKMGPNGYEVDRKGFLGALLNSGNGAHASQISQQWQKEDEAKKQQQIENDLKRQQIYSDMNLKKQAFNLEVAKLNDKATEGQKALDKDFAKDYNDWTSGGGSRARNEISKLESVVERLKSGQGGTGGFTGVLGDRFTSNDVLKNRADVQQSAMSLIKVLLSGATSDKDREQIVNTLWNEADSTENNKARIERFVADMKSRADQTDVKANYFKQSGTLGGYDPSSKQMPSISEADAAFKWAKQNPNDPRASKIMKELGVK